MTAAPSVPGPASPDAPASLFPALVRLARPKQWVKNVLVVAAPGAAGVLGEGKPLFRTGVAFVCFCLAASGTYYINDALDADADRHHPTKRFRPVASGAVPVRLAIGGGIGLLVASIGLSFVARWPLALVLGGYVAQTMLYSLWLKHEAVLDLACVASGFVLRTIAGGVAVGVTISPWFLIVAGSASLFMVTGKRHAELRELGSGATATRRSLETYSQSFLSYVRTVSSSVTLVAYCLWTVDRSSQVGNPVWFQLSIVPFVLGILRYSLLVDQGGGGAPEELVLSDRVLLLLGATWALIFAIGVKGY